MGCGLWAVGCGLCSFLGRVDIYPLATVSSFTANGYGVKAV
jgi:hypothetical protein